jgi:hypothetical protein
MIWEQNITIIVMLSSIIERGVVRLDFSIELKIRIRREIIMISIQAAANEFSPSEDDFSSNNLFDEISLIKGLVNGLIIIKR